MTIVTDKRAILDDFSLAGYDRAGNPLTGQPLFVSYSFETSVTGFRIDGNLGDYPQSFVDSFRPFDATDQAIARAAFQQWDAASGLTFFEVPAGMGEIKLGDFNFDYSPQIEDAIGYGGGGMVFISTLATTTTQLLLHEIGHNLGFKHPFEGSDVLARSLDNWGQTVMSYTSAGYSGDTLGPIDRDAAAYLYGQPGSDGQQVASWSWDPASFTLTQTGFAQGGVINGIGGNNVITGSGAGDLIDIVAHGANATIAAGAGDDVIFLPMGGRFAVDGGDGDDYLEFDAPYDQPTTFSLPALLAAGNRLAGIELIDIDGSSAADRLTAGPIDAYLYGYEGNDTLTGGGGGDRISGGLDNDLLAGGDGDDSLLGGSGDDSLAGGGGADALYGGAGADLFTGTLAEWGGDTIFDLAAGDRIVVGDVARDALAFSLAAGILRLGTQTVTLDGFAGTLKLSAGSHGEAVLAPSTTGAVAGDFTGDGRSDILWRNLSGAFSAWQVTGGARGDRLTENVYSAGIDTSWRIVSIADTGGDGRADIVWRNANGTFSIWNGADRGFQQGSYTDGSVGTEWTIAATGDFTGDGKDDLLWRNADGALSVWRSTGAGFAANSYAHGPVSLDWRVVGTADFTGDGRDDILWRNGGGTISLWRSTGTGFAENSFADGSVGNDWHIVGLGDFNGDGRDDLLWRNAAGAISTWQANAVGGFDRNSYFDGSVPTGWGIAAVGDFNADGKADLLWRNANGALSTWEGTGSGFVKNVASASVDPSWAIVGHDFSSG